MEKEVDNKYLYKRKRNKIDWKESYKNFKKEHGFACYLLNFILSISAAPAITFVIWFIIYSAEHNPSYLLYLLLAFVVYAIIHIGIAFYRSIKFKK